MTADWIIKILKVMVYITVLFLLCTSFLWSIASILSIHNSGLIILQQPTIWLKKLTLYGSIFSIFSVIIIILLASCFKSHYRILRVLAVRIKESLRLLSVSLILSLIAFSYPIMNNDLKQNEENYENFLSESIIGVDSIAYDYIVSGNFLKLSDEFIENEYQSGNMNFKIIPNYQLSKNIEFSKKGDFEEILLSAKSPYLKDSFDDFNFSNPEIGEYGWTVEKKNIEYGTKIHFSAEIMDDEPSCFRFEMESMDKLHNKSPIYPNVPFWSHRDFKSESYTFCLIEETDIDDGFKKYRFGLVASADTIDLSPEDLDKIVFKITNLDKNEKRIPKAFQATLRTDLSKKGNTPYIMAFCMEGYHVSNPSKVISYIEGQIKNESCPKRL